MERKYLPVFGLAITLYVFSPCDAATSDSCLQLNNDAVKDINSQRWPAAIAKLEAALKVDPGYKLAVENLATAHFYFGKKLEAAGHHKESLKHFHRALYFLSDRNPTLLRSTVEEAINRTIEKLGSKPTSFADRVRLGDTARRESDLIGAVVEYRYALLLHDDSSIKEKLAEVLSHLD
jgi:tetratricopeptide (TPR) repeat protein